MVNRKILNPKMLNRKMFNFQTNYQQQHAWEAQQRKDDYYKDNIYSSSPTGYKPTYQPSTPATAPPSLPSQSYKLPQVNSLIPFKTQHFFCFHLFTFIVIMSFSQHQPLQPLHRTPNSLRDLAYKPSIPQGWNAPPAKLPNGNRFSLLNLKFL